MGEDDTDPLRMDAFLGEESNDATDARRWAVEVSLGEESNAVTEPRRKNEAKFEEGEELPMTVEACGELDEPKATTEDRGDDVLTKLNVDTR